VAFANPMTDSTRAAPTATFHARVAGVGLVTTVVVLLAACMTFMLQQWAVARTQSHQVSASLAQITATTAAPASIDVEWLIGTQTSRWWALSGSWLAVAFSVGFGLYVNFEAQGKETSLLSALMATLPPLLKVNINEGASRDWIESSLRYGARQLSEMLQNEPVDRLRRSTRFIVLGTLLGRLFFVLALLVSGAILLSLLSALFATWRQLSIAPVGQGAMHALQLSHLPGSTT